MHYNYPFFILLFWFFATTTQAQPISYFEKTFDISGWSDNGNAIINDDSGGYMLISASRCFNQLRCSGLVKSDLEGQEIWSKLFHSYPNTFGVTDVQKESNGSYLMTGTTYVTQNDDYIPFVMKLNMEGDSLWVINFDDTNKDSSNKLEPTSDGNYLMDIVGGVYGQYSEIILQKVTPQGEALWEQPLETGYQYHYPGNIQVLPNDEIAVAYTFRPYNDPTNSDYDAALAKTDSLGNVVWNTFLGNTIRSECGAVTKICPDGDLIAAWCRDTTGVGLIANNNPVVYKINTVTGEAEWEYYFFKQKVRKLSDITIAANGDIIGCGKITLSGQRAWLFRLSPQGELLWEKYYSSALSPSNLVQFNEVVEAPDGGITAIGFIVEQDSIGSIPNGNVWLVHLDSVGCFTPGCVSDTIVITDIREPAAPGEPAVQPLFFSAAPNPSAGSVQVVFEEPLPWQQARIRIWDARGRLAQQIPLHKGAHQAELDLSALPPGLYLIALEAEGRVWQTSRVVRE